MSSKEPSGLQAFVPPNSSHYPSPLLLPDTWPAAYCRLAGIVGCMWQHWAAGQTCGRLFLKR